MSGRQTTETAGAKDATLTQGEGALSPQVQSIKEALEKYLRPPMNELGVSERHRNNIIAVGVKECAEQFDKGLDRIVFAGVHKVKNLVVIETNIKYSSIMYDAIAASKVDSRESLAAAELACTQAHGGPEGQPQALTQQQNAEQEKQQSGPNR